MSSWLKKLAIILPCPEITFQQNTGIGCIVVIIVKMRPVHYDGLPFISSHRTNSYKPHVTG